MSKPTRYRTTEFALVVACVVLALLIVFGLIYTAIAI